MEQAAGTKPFLNLVREYPVAPEKVWRAWTDPQGLKQWFGPGTPEGVSVAELDVRVGGRYRIVFGGAQGTDHEVQGTYLEVVPHRKLAFTWSWPRTTPERESRVTVVFQATNAGTRLDFRHEQFFDEAARDGHQRGWTAAFANLDKYFAEQSRA